MATPEEIVDLLREASLAYYNGGPVKMDDDTYDGLIERLRQLDPENDYLQEIGAPVQGAVKLPYAMPSLDKIKPGEATLKRFLAHTTGFIISEKLDGLSALWIPSTNQLLLRGNGIMGQDISHLVELGIQGLSKRCPPSTAIRGELILPRSTGITLARSWVNGQIHQKTPNPKDIAKIRFVAYAVLDPAHRFNRSQQFQMMRGYGLELPWFSMANTLSEAYLAEVLQDRRVNSLYDTDGIVVALNTVPKSESTAEKAKNPKDCVAFKMPLAEQSAETVVREIIWSPSSQGYLIPRIRFDPVNISSARIEFCTGHNARMIYAHGLGPGAKIVIRRSGDVIPKLDKVLTATVPSFPPDGTWEWCGDSHTAVHVKSVGITTATITAKLYHFLKTLEIPGVGPATASTLVEGGITGPSALWATSPTTLSTLLGPKTGASLYTNLRSILATVDEVTLMQASSTMPRGIGDSKLKSIFAVEPDPRKWNNLSTPTGWTAESLSGFLTEFSAYVTWRLKEISWIPYPILSKPTAIATVIGETICMTGFRDKDIEVKASVRGHTFVPNITGKVSILLVPDGTVKESEKVIKARSKNIRILSRTEFIAQYLS